MKPEDFIKELENEDNFDYGLCAPPVKADKGLSVLIEHFLGKDWYVVMPISQEQANTEAIYRILDKNQKPKTLLDRLLKR